MIAEAADIPNMEKAATRVLGETKVTKTKYNGRAQPAWKVVEQLETEYADCKKRYLEMPDAQKRMIWVSRKLFLFPAHCTLETPAE